MAEKSTYIKLDRNIMQWRWWHDHNTLIVFLVLLMNANIQEHAFNAVNIRRGEVACSYSTISQQAHLSIQKVRTAISHLKSTGEITSRTYSKYQVITIVNYDKYQGEQQAKQHNKQQSINKQSTSKQQQYKNNKNDKNEKKNPPKSPQGGLAPDGEIPEMYRDQFETYSEYLAWRNQ